MAIALASKTLVIMAPLYAMPTVSTLVRPSALVLALSCLVACSRPEPVPEPVATEQEDMTGRNTPLNEEVDEVSKVRDEVLENSPR